MTKRQLIFILGMHRSGTSVLTRCLNLQGVTLPKTIMLPQKDNEKGFWESLPIVRFNNRLLKEAGVAWDDPKPIAASWWQSSEIPEWINQASLLLQQEFSYGELVVLKDPRLSRLMPIWIEACKKTDFSPLVLLCCRNPLDVASSLERRNEFNLQHAERLWLRYMLEAEKGSRGLVRSVVHFDNLIDNWKDTIEQACTNIGLEMPLLKGDVADKINAFISPNLIHHNAKKASHLYDNDKLESLAKDTYEGFFHKLLDECVFDDLLSRLNHADLIELLAG